MYEFRCLGKQGRAFAISFSPDATPSRPCVSREAALAEAKKSIDYLLAI